MGNNQKDRGIEGRKAGLLQMLFLCAAQIIVFFSISPTPLLPPPSREGKRFITSLQGSVLLYTLHFLTMTKQANAKPNVADGTATFPSPQGEDNNFSIHIKTAPEFRSCFYIIYYEYTISNPFPSYFAAIHGNNMPH